MNSREYCITKAKKLKGCLREVKLNCFYRGKQKKGGKIIIFNSIEKRFLIIRAIKQRNELPHKLGQLSTNGSIYGEADHL